MTLRLEEIKIVPSVLQEHLDNDNTVILKCDMNVPNNMNNNKTFKLNLRSTFIKPNIPNIHRWFDHNDHSVLQPHVKRTLQKSTVLTCFLNFPINKIVRGIHPFTLEWDDCATHHEADREQEKEQYTWDEQLKSWLSLYDVEISSYLQSDIDADASLGADMDAFISEDLLTCSSNLNDDLMFVEYKRLYRDPLNKEHVEYLYYLTPQSSFKQEFIKSAMEEYHDLFNSGTTQIYKNNFKCHNLKLSAS